MSQDLEVRAILNATRVAICDCRVAMLYAAKREIEMEELARKLGVPVVDVWEWIEFLRRGGQA